MELKNANISCKIDLCIKIIQIEAEYLSKIKRDNSFIA